jgi:hypothetical protein
MRFPQLKRPGAIRVKASGEGEGWGCEMTQYLTEKVTDQVTQQAAKDFLIRREN